MIVIQGVEKRYGDLKAVSDLNFSIERGEIVGLLGQNGAGKTTCMKIITGYLEPTAGTVTVDGLDVIDQRTEVQDRVGYLPENAPLYPEMRVEEYLSFISELRGLRGKEAREAIKEALEATGLTDRRRQEISTLSKGYKQRVGLAQAIVHKPSILILDEPTNGLDPVQIQEIRSLIKRLAEDTTILLSTHILSEIEAVCHRVVILIDGQIATDSTLKELLDISSIRLKVRAGDEGSDEEMSEVLITTHEQIERVTRIGESSEGYPLYNITIKEGEEPSLLISQVAKTCLNKGWLLGGIDVETQSLESAFKSLMSDHVERALNS